MKNKFLSRKNLSVVAFALSMVGAQPAMAVWDLGWSKSRLNPYNEGNTKVREEYNVAVTQAYEAFKEKVAIFHQNQQSFNEDLAREAVAKRAAIKQENYDKTSIIGRVGLVYERSWPNLQRNVWSNQWENKSFSWADRSYEDYIREGKTPEEAAYGAFGTGGGDMGLKNNGVGDIIKIWKVIKSTGNLDIYPEHLDQKDVEWFKARANGKLSKEGGLTPEGILDSYQEYLDKIDAERGTTSILPWAEKAKALPLAKNIKTLQETDTGLVDSTAETPGMSSRDAGEEGDSILTPEVIDPRAKVIAEQLAHYAQAEKKQVEATNKRIDQLQRDMQQNDKKAMRGIASVAAMGNTVFPSAPGKTAVGAGVGSYDGVQAVAITISHRPEQLSQMSFQAGMATSTGGKPVMRMGASYEF